MTRRLRRCSTLLLAVPLLGGLALAAPAQAAVANPVGAAAGWLTTQFADSAHLPAPTGDHFDSKFGSSYFPNYGENADVLFGLAAAKVGRTKATVALDYLNAHLSDYADTTGAFGGPFDGSVAKVALARIVAGTSATDLLTILKADECKPSAKASNAAKSATRAAKKAASCTPGAPASIFASASASFVILAEARAGGSFAPSAAATDYFLSLQCASGGFTTGTTACGAGDADIDATSYAIMALQALGGHTGQIADAADWLEGQRNAGGYWVSQGIPNTNSTGLAAAALAGVGRSVATSRAWLLDQQIGAGQPGAGALKYGGEFTPTTTSATSPNVLATAQALLALTTNGSLATVTASGSTTGVTLLPAALTLSNSSIAPGGSATVTAAGFAAGERVVAFFDQAAKGPVGRGKADASGHVSISFSIRATTGPGTGSVLLIGQSSGLRPTVRLTVTGSATSTPPTTGTGTATGSPIPAPTTTGPPLANTGTDSAQLLPLGVLSLLAGAGIVAVAQKRRRGRHAA